MSMPLETHEVKEIIAAVVQELRSDDGLTKHIEESHQRQHEWLETHIKEEEERALIYAWVRVQMEKEKDRRDLVKKIQGSVFGWMIIVTLGALGLAVWQFIKNQIKGIS